MIILIIEVSLLLSCKKFIEIDPPKNSLVPATVFKNKDLASSAMLGIYQQMAQSGFASGDATSISTICGVCADEFIGYDAVLKPIYDNQIIPETSRTNAIWEAAYKRIYDSTAILKGLDGDGVDLPVKVQLQGEALFIRAFSYFYLVNLFGPVPLQMSTDYEVNRQTKRSPVNEVYKQILNDLLAAEVLLGDNYITNERVRPNKATVQAMLARVYIYLSDWQNAEKYSTLVIQKVNMYKLIGLDQIFLSNSQEAIWQLMPSAGNNTLAGSFLILTGITVPTYTSLRPDFVAQAFEANDKRKISWVKSILSNTTTYYYPFKYKVKSSTNVTEYTMVFRLAEQYLIRAESRAQLNKLTDAILDLDEIRNRAGLSRIINSNPEILKDDLIKLIYKERRVELFSEWGDRWLDLKRTDRANSVLSLIKPNWKPMYQLFPIPKNEVERNKNINQNDGY